MRSRNLPLRSQFTISEKEINLCIILRQTDVNNHIERVLNLLIPDYLFFSKNGEKLSEVGIN
jgi:hypothetical protein